MTRMNPGTIIVSAVMLVVAIMVLANSNITFPPEGWLVASLLGAVFVYIAGERLIKKWGLTDFSAMATRVAFAFGALVVAGIGISQIWSGGTPSFGWLSGNGLTIAVIFGALTVLVMYAWGVKRFMKDGATFFTKGTTVVVTVIVITLLLLVMVLDQTLTLNLLDGVQNAAQQGAGSLVETTRTPNGTVVNTINWDAISGIDWYRVGIVAILSLSPLVLFKEYMSKNKWAVGPVLAVALVVTLGQVYYMLKYYEPAREVFEDVSGALGAASEPVMEIMGENHFVDLQSAPGHRLIVANIGPYDTLSVMVPDGSSVDWQAYPGYENVPGYDPTGYYLYNTTGQGGWKRYYDFTEEFEEGLNATGKTLTLEIWAVK